MKKLFSPLRNEDASRVIKTLAPVIRILIMITALFGSISILVTAIRFGHFSDVLLALWHATFRIIVGIVLGILSEALLVGFSIVVSKNEVKEENNITLIESTNKEETKE